MRINYFLNIILINYLSIQITYEFNPTTKDNFGEYSCLAENTLGISKQSIKIDLLTSEITIISENVFSDAYIFEYSCLSGSSLKKLWIEVELFL